MQPDPTTTSRSVSRREFLWNFGGGLGGIALAQLLADGGLLAEARAADAQAQSAGGLHHPAKAKRVVQLFMSGAASQCDTFDYKPELIKRNGQPFDPGEKVELFQSSPGDCMASPWAWKQYGQCGKWISDLVPHLATCVDDIAFIHSMVSKSNVHGPATFMQNTGFVLPGFPSMGAWVSLRPGEPDRQSADVRRAARRARLCAQRPGQLERRLSAGRASGNDDPARRPRTRSPICFRPPTPSSSRRDSESRRAANCSSS